MNSSHVHNENIPPQTSKHDSKPPAHPRKAVLQANTAELVDPIDMQDAKNPQRLSCYAQEITVNLYDAEVKYQPSADFMDQQQDVNYKMRAILVDWLVSVHLKFRLLPETLFLTVSMVDRYLEKKAVMRQQLQLVGVTAMFLACKYEEIYPPELKDFISVTDRAYTKEQLVRMEIDMLKVLQFHITVPTAWRFLERFAHLAEATESAVALSRYLLELPLVEYHMARYKPSVQAAAALFLANKILKVEAPWSTRLSAMTTYSDLQLRPCAKDMLILFQAAPRHTLGAVREKFSRRDNLEVSKLRVA